MKDVFHKINMLDNYSSHLWFKNMELMYAQTPELSKEDKEFNKLKAKMYPKKRK